MNHEEYLPFSGEIKEIFEEAKICGNIILKHQSLRQTFILYSESIKSNLHHKYEQY